MRILLVLGSIGLALSTLSGPSAAHGLHTCSSRTIVGPRAIAVTRNLARKAALLGWMHQVRVRYGGAWANFAMATGRYSVDRRQGVFYTYQISARPCRHGVWPQPA